MRWVRKAPPARRTAFVAATITALATAAFLGFTQERGRRVSQINTPSGTMVVEIADTPAARSAGLSNRDELRDIDGLLLKWDEAGKHPIWMAGMRFSLDLIWIDGEGRVLTVLAAVPPCRVEPCRLYMPASAADSVAVLELPAGAAAKSHLNSGTIVRFPAPKSR
jgi:uncharacterized membrane protein (UPF0127 family)